MVWDDSGQIGFQPVQPSLEVGVGGKGGIVGHLPGAGLLVHVVEKVAAVRGEHQRIHVGPVLIVEADVLQLSCDQVVRLNPGEILLRVVGCGLQDSQQVLKEAVRADVGGANAVGRVLQHIPFGGVPGINQLPQLAVQDFHAIKCDMGRRIFPNTSLVFQIGLQVGFPGQEVFLFGQFGDVGGLSLGFGGLVPVSVGDPFQIAIPVVQEFEMELGGVLGGR